MNKKATENFRLLILCSAVMMIFGTARSNAESVLDTNSAEPLKDAHVEAASTIKTLVARAERESKAWDLATSLKSFDEAILYSTNCSAPQDPEVLYCKATAFSGRANVEKRLSKYDDAINSYNKAITICSAIVELSPDKIDSYDLSAKAHIEIADLQAKLLQNDDAVVSCNKALKLCDQIKQRFPKNLQGYLRSASAHVTLGFANTNKRDSREPLVNCKKAISDCKQAAKVAKNDSDIFFYEGQALERIAFVQSLNSNREALSSYKRSISAFDNAIRQSPNVRKLHNAKAIAQTYYAEQLGQVAQNTASLANSQQAIKTLDDSLSEEPENLDLLNLKAIALVDCGDGNQRISQPVEALMMYKKSLHICEKILEKLPSNMHASYQMGIVQMRLGEQQSSMQHFEDAKSAYENSIQTFDRLLKTENAYGLVQQAYSKRAFCYMGLGDLQAMSSDRDAVVSYKKAIEDCDLAIRKSQLSSYGRRLKARILVKLGDAQGRL